MSVRSFVEAVLRLPAPSPARGRRGLVLEATLTRAWLRRGPLACVLWPLSLLFRVISGVRYHMYRCGLLRATRLPVPVIVVGNIFIGGTGKTPLTIWLVHALQQAGFKPGVISRGHGSAERLPRLVTVMSSAQQVGDEPLLIARRSACPVMVGRDRAAAGRALLQAHPELTILISDDGLQHYALQRDLEIVLFDARGTGNGWCLPAGPLRETAQRRRDFTVVNAPQLTPQLPKLLASVARLGVPTIQMELVGEFAERLSNRSERVALSVLAKPGVRIVAAAGIGNPGRFFAMLKSSGLRFAELPLPDHHDFLDQPFAALAVDIILITEKDAVKCAQIETLNDDPRLWVVPVTARIDAAMAQQIVEKCRGCSTA